MQHRRRAAPAARGRAVAAALGVLLACLAIAGTALAAAGGAGHDPAADVLTAARKHLGDPYVFGATGPASWDCSGLTSRMWRDAGGVTDIPRVASDQQAWAVPIPVEQLLVGDLVFFGNPVSHVGLYAGNSTIVDASSSQHMVVERKIWKQADIRYGRVPRPGMPPVTPWASPSPSPSPSATAGSTSSASTDGTATPAPTATATPTASARPTPRATPTATPRATPTATPRATPTAKPSPQPTRTASNATSDSAALTAPPLRGLPAPDLPALTTVAANAVRNAVSVTGSAAWTDVSLIQAAWRHAGGGLLPHDRAHLVAAGAVVPIAAARIGDLVSYGSPADHLGVYLGHGFMVDASPTLGRVVIRRVFASSRVQIVRLNIG